MTYGRRRALFFSLLFCLCAPVLAQVPGDYFVVEPLSGRMPPPWMPRGVVLDFNGDGHLDVVYAWPGKLVTLQNDGTGRLVLREDGARLDPDVPIDWPRDLAVADFDGDGRQDVFLADHGLEPQDRPWENWPGGQSQIFMGTADGFLREETSTRFPQETSYTHGKAVGDINGDGAPDIYLAHYGFAGSHPEPRFYINDGTGRFTSEPERIPATVRDVEKSAYPSAVLLDADNDGDLDLALGGNPFSARDLLLLNDGTGHFTLAPEEAMPLRYAGSVVPEGDWRKSEWATWSVDTADFDGDGWADLVMTTLFDFTTCSTCPNSNPYEETRVQLLLNNRDGTFRDATHRIPQAWKRVHADRGEGWLTFTTPTDLNEDGYPDLVTNGFNVESRIFVNIDGEYFVDATEFVPELSGRASMIVPGDFTGDGDTDLAVIGRDGGESYLAWQTSPFIFEERWRPALAAFTPASGEPGTTVTVTGTGLARAVRARVAGVETDFAVVSDTEIAITVPEGVSAGPVALTTRFGTVTSTADFVVTAAPQIVSLSPPSAGVGREVVISGRYFDAVTDVTFGGVSAAFRVRSGTEIVTTVPRGAASGALRVVSPYGEVTADFAVFTPPAQASVLRFENAIALAPAPAEAPLLNLGAEFTMEAWVRIGEAPGTGQFLGKIHPVSEDPWSSYSFSFYDGKVRFAQSTGAPGSNRFVDAPTVAEPGVWFPVAGTRRADTLRLFIDGQEVGRVRSAGLPANDTAPFALGSGILDSGQMMIPFAGSLREVRVWGKALTATEIRALAPVALSGSEDGLVAYWPLSEGQGRVAADLGPHGYDLSLGLSPQQTSHVPIWTATQTGTGIDTPAPGPADAALAVENSPNPFHLSTSVRFTLPAPADVNVEVVDLLGRQVAVLAKGRYMAGAHTVVFEAGAQPSGLYFVVVTTERQREGKPMLLAR